ncbi:hypothetical protein DPEC_G00222760 [Dallia pectoralis]|uniref:Uncharacterized protein n=1 Tax=Dallia pectoralis TaxID=75939 RepID=A0ACC2FZV7_DALPE|nr:hypothetical protein DPEC_G00222760 [Dallia pectoralis]
MENAIMKEMPGWLSYVGWSSLTYSRSLRPVEKLNSPLLSYNCLYKGAVILVYQLATRWGTSLDAHELFWPL